MDKLIISDNPLERTNLGLSQIYILLTKEQMLRIAKRLDIWVRPNVSKPKIVERLADAVLENPIEVVTRLARVERQLLDVVKAGPNQGVRRKMRKACYMLQKLGFVVTYQDWSVGEWIMFMPNEVRASIADEFQPFLEVAQKGLKRLSACNLRSVPCMEQMIDN